VCTTYNPIAHAQSKERWCRRYSPPPPSDLAFLSRVLGRYQYETVPIAGDVIIDADTGPPRYFHATIVVDTLPTYDPYTYAVAVDYGIDENLNMAIGYRPWAYADDTGVHKDHKYVLRFHPPSSIQMAGTIGSIQLASVERFHKAVTLSTVRLMHLYKRKHAGFFTSTNFTTLLKTALSRCGPPRFNQFDELHAAANSCGETKAPKAILCSKFVVQSLQLSLFDWLDYGGGGELRALDSTVKKEIIRTLLPVEAEECAPRYLKNVLKDSEYWILVRFAKPTAVELLNAHEKEYYRSKSQELETNAKCPVNNQIVPASLRVYNPMKG
jgi:hypothetical protein